MKTFVMALALVVSSQTAVAEEWRSNYFEGALSRSPAGARQLAAQKAYRQSAAKQALCRDVGGAPSFATMPSECYLSGAEDFYCYAQGQVACDIGDVTPADRRDLGGTYLDAAQAAFLMIDPTTRRMRGSYVSPFNGGTLFSEVGPLSRTGADTYEARALFPAASGECQGEATIKIETLDDGSLILGITSKGRVSAIIFGSCVWEGSAASYYELKPIELAP